MVHQKTNAYLGEINVNGGISTEDCIYNKATNKATVYNAIDNLNQTMINYIARDTSNKPLTIPTISTTQ